MVRRQVRGHPGLSALRGVDGWLRCPPIAWSQRGDSNRRPAAYQVGALLLSTVVSDRHCAFFLEQLSWSVRLHGTEPGDGEPSRPTGPKCLATGRAAERLRSIDGRSGCSREPSSPSRREPRSYRSVSWWAAPCPTSRRSVARTRQAVEEDPVVPECEATTPDETVSAISTHVRDSLPARTVIRRLVGSFYGEVECLRRPSRRGRGLTDGPAINGLHVARPPGGFVSGPADVVGHFSERVRRPSKVVRASSDSQSGSSQCRV